jgi:hypothetical protein
MLSASGTNEVPLADRDTHWLGSPSRNGKTIWETIPFLLVGAGAWDTDVASFPEPAMGRYGRVGAPGSPWWVMVKRSDKEPVSVGCHTVTATAAVIATEQQQQSQQQQQQQQQSQQQQPQQQGEYRDIHRLVSDSCRRSLLPATASPQSLWMIRRGWKVRKAFGV